MIVQLFVLAVNDCSTVCLNCKRLFNCMS